jgi:MYXO-CTERM domain-containing protein
MHARPGRSLLLLSLFGLPSFLATACSFEAPVAPARAPLTAYCEASVVGTGVVDVETDYIPRVVRCENGSADTAALEAQAIAARSALYYKLDRYGEIGDGTGSQVYTCSRALEDRHVRAAEATAGLVLRYRDTQVYGFYVAGARNQPPPDCRGSTDDPTGTEHYVTYNEGRSGDDLTQSTIGYVAPTNYANRGCMSQNGSHCLSLEGRSAEEILRFYFGEDIEIVRAEGACVSAPPDPVEPDAGRGTASDAGQEGADAGEPLLTDAAAPPPVDPPTPPSPPGSSRLVGGCAVSTGPNQPTLAPLLTLLALFRRGRRST